MKCFYCGMERPRKELKFECPKQWGWWCCKDGCPPQQDRHVVDYRKAEFYRRKGVKP